MWLQGLAASTRMAVRSSQRSQGQLQAYKQLRCLDFWHTLMRLLGLAAGSHRVVLHGPKLALCTHTVTSVLVAQLCPTLCDPMDCSLPGSSVHSVFQARITGVGFVANCQCRSWVLGILQQVLGEDRGKQEGTQASGICLQRQNEALRNRSCRGPQWLCWPLVSLMSKVLGTFCGEVC